VIRGSGLNPGGGFIESKAMTEEEYWEERREQDRHEYQCWLDGCQGWATNYGCPDDYVQDEQRWRSMFDSAMTPDEAVQEDLKEGAE
jgi:hypothetical protein